MRNFAQSDGFWFTEEISESILGLKLALELLGVKTLIEFWRGIAIMVMDYLMACLSS